MSEIIRVPWLDPKEHPPPLRQFLLLKRSGCNWYKGKITSEDDVNDLEGWQYPPLDEVK